jgi:hypothetical protein
MKLVALSYGRALLYVGASVLSAVIGAHLLNSARLSFLSDDFVRWLRIFTSFLFASATLGRCGWDIQTWGGASPEEIWNLRVFRILYIVGFALLVLSFLIKPG